MNLLVDVRNFRDRPAPDNTTWRDAAIVPRYNAGGVSKMAFLLPAGSGSVGPPQPEGPANFPTRVVRLEGPARRVAERGLTAGRLHVSTQTRPGYCRDGGLVLASPKARARRASGGCRRGPVTDHTP